MYVCMYVCMYYVMLYYVLSSLCVRGQRPGTSSQERVHSPGSTARDELQTHLIVSEVNILAPCMYVRTYVCMYVCIYVRMCNVWIRIYPS